MNRGDGRDEDTRASGFAGSDAPTPARGIPTEFEDVPGQRSADDGTATRSEETTPPAGIGGLVGPDGVIGQGVVEPEDFGHAGPAVLGEPDPGEQGPREEATDWPKLEYRSRAKQQRPGAMDWLRGGRDET